MVKTSKLWVSFISFGIGYGKPRTPMIVGLFGMCSALSYMFTNTISIKQRVGQVILNRFGVHTLNKVIEHGLLGDNIHILHSLIPEFNFLQMEGDIPRMQKILGLTSIPPEDFMQWVEEKPPIIANNYWWDTHDREIRLKAFDKLISIYQNRMSMDKTLEYGRRD